jgi:hypothetical protein
VTDLLLLLLLLLLNCRRPANFTFDRHYDANG